MGPEAQGGLTDAGGAKRYSVLGEHGGVERVT